jgi:hypothetical protein
MPRPEPKAKRINDTLVATKAPAMIAGQDAADFPVATNESAPNASGRGYTDPSMIMLLN